MDPEFSTFFDQMPTGAYRTDIDGRYLRVNRALQGMLGLPDEPASLRALNDPASGLFPPGHRDRLLRRLKAEGRISDVVCTITRPDGETRVLREYAWLVQDAGGGPSHYEGTVQNITERDRFESSLQVTLDYAGRGILRLDAEGRIVLYNREALRLLDLPESVVAGQALIGEVIRFQGERGDFGAHGELFVGDAVDAYQKEAESGILQALLKAGHYLRRTRAGRVLEVSSQRLPDGGMVRTYSDVTDYVVAQEALAEKSRALRITLDSMSQGICTMDADGVVTLSNRRHQELLGFPEGLMETRPTMDQLVRFQRDRGDFGTDHEFVDASARAYVAAGHSKSPLEGPVTYLRRTREGRTLEVHTRPLPDGGSVRTFTDVTDYVQAREALALKQAQLAALVNNLPDRVWLKDTQGVYRLSNPAHQRFHGMPESAIVGRTAHELLGDAQGDRQAVTDAQAIATREPIVLDQEQVDPVTGRVQHIEVVKVAMRDENDRCIGVLGIARDITARKETEAALIAARDAAREGERAKAEFLANMSHEIRTPMNAVLGLSDLLATTALSDVQRSYVAAIRTSGDSLLRLINDILDFSKFEAGRLEVEHAPMDLRACLEEVLAITRGPAEAKDLPLQLRVGTDVPRRVLGDAVRLRQVLVNLVSNAVKFTSRGEVRITVTRSRLPDGRDALRFVVRDTGIGIPADRMGRLFQVFSQVDASTTRQFGGTGLGLAICKRLVGLMGGRIGVQSEPGSGSEFSVELPCEEVAAAPPASPTATTGPREQARDYPLRLLLAEDNEINQMVAEHMLLSLGYQVTVVDNGQRALDAVAQARQAGQPFDVVLMDVQMPVLDGLEASRRLVDLHADPAARPWIIAMTANAMQGDREQCLAAGMDQYLSKPIRAEDLGAMLREAHGALATRRR